MASKRRERRESRCGTSRILCAPDAGDGAVRVWAGAVGALGAVVRGVVEGRKVESGRAGAEEDEARTVGGGARGACGACGGGIAGLVVALGETMVPAERRRLSMWEMPRPVGVVVEWEGWMEDVTMAGRLRR